MSQAYLVANLDGREFITPGALGSDETQLMSIASGLGTSSALCVLLAASNGKGAGDLYWDPDESERRSHRDHPIARHIVGRWAGERIAIIGDYYDGDEHDAPIGLDATAFRTIAAQEDGWVDISEHVAATLDIDAEIRRVRHEIHVAPSGARYSDADGFAVDSALPRAPRSLLDPETGKITAITTMPPVDPLSEPTTARPLPADAAERLQRALDRAANMAGALSDESRAAIMLAAVHPTSRTWDAVASMTIEPKHLVTPWSAIGMLDPEFPMSATHDEVDGRQWERVPDGDIIVRALELAVEIGEDPDAAARYRASTDRAAKRWGPRPAGSQD
jgi:hypothetical protein